ncbi:MAG: FtsW/RodA/SpoVE family cell cycle protein [Oscillospiraceae bacterium]|nr:FtsW/RodA/SpoVE family cell cycle protein [Oscillospiraceae bacterium]
MDEFERIYQEKLNKDHNLEQLPEPPVRNSKLAKRKKRGHMDWPVAVLVLLILAIGTVMVLSSSYAREYYEGTTNLATFRSQLIFALGGVLAMFAFQLFPMQLYNRSAVPIMLFAVIALALVMTPLGQTMNGARRWLKLGITFQPSEIAKFGIVLVFAAYMSKDTEFALSGRRKRGQPLRNYIGQEVLRILPLLIVAAVVLALLLKEPHVSACIIITSMCVAMMWTGGVKKFWFVLLLIPIAAVVLYVVKELPSREVIGKMTDKELRQYDYVLRRVIVWLAPERFSTGEGLQVLQSLYAVGSGGLTGLGLGQSRQKLLWLPEQSNDYIFAIVCEELGLIGALLVLALFALLIFRCFWIALKARRRFDKIVCIGYTAKLLLQVFFNVAVVTNLIPCTGISLPFFSSGGTALLLQMAEMGIILNVSRGIGDEEEAVQ